MSEIQHPTVTRLQKTWLVMHWWALLAIVGPGYSEYREALANAVRAVA